MRFIITCIVVDAFKPAILARVLKDLGVGLLLHIVTESILLQMALGVETVQAMETVLAAHWLIVVDLGMLINQGVQLINQLKHAQLRVISNIWLLFDCLFQD